MKQYNEFNFICATVVAVMLSLVPSIVVGADQDIGVISYQADTNKIYAFHKGSNNHLHVNYWNGSKWQWADQGTPSGTMVSGAPGVITYHEGTKPQRIYAFVRGANGRLYVNYWNGSKWQWADQGTPSGTTIIGTPGVVTYQEGTKPQRIYAFIQGANGRLYVNYWNGSKWQWADQGTPSGTTITGTPGVVTYQEGTKPQRIYAFVQGANGRLYVNYWNGSRWQWADQGTAPGTKMTGTPGVVTYREGTKPQRIYAFVRGANAKLYVNYWNGSKWQWANQGGGYVQTSPGVITYQEGTKSQRIYAFFGSWSGDIIPPTLYVNYWNGSKWQMVDQGKSPDAPHWDGFTKPSVITHRVGTKPQLIYAFVRGANDKLYVNYWNGSKWQWANQGGL